MASPAPSVIPLPAAHHYEATIEKVVPYETLRRFLQTSFVDSLSLICVGTGRTYLGAGPTRTTTGRGTAN